MGDRRAAAAGYEAAVASHEGEIGLGVSAVDGEHGRVGARHPAVIPALTPRPSPGALGRRPSSSTRTNPARAADRRSMMPGSARALIVGQGWSRTTTSPPNCRTNVAGVRCSARTSRTASVPFATAGRSGCSASKVNATRRAANPSALLLDAGDDDPPHEEALGHEEDDHGDDDRHQGCRLDELDLLAVDAVELCQACGDRLEVG